MTIPEIFACDVFNDEVMKERLPKDVYDSLKATINEYCDFNPAIAQTVANAMKDWALEKGATHYTHWFQPMTGITAEKHDSFITPTKDGGVIMEFSGKELTKGESDASSFPNGGIRATFEARGYTAWDPTSYAFIKDGSLCIPTAFCSYGGQALDKKTPLLRSMQALNKQAKRILKLFGNDAKNVYSTVGPEQEYFLIDKNFYNKRMDLVIAGRTLFGSPPPKGQHLKDHYYGAIRTRVSNYMKDLDTELWKLGILAKTKHNEAAPAQHELAPIFTTTNVSADHNQLTMEIMKKIAENHGLVCLLHEKPFAGVNGSGKHNNWSLSTDKGVNLLNPGDTPEDNAQFMLFLSAVIKAVDNYQDLLRVSVASAGNDHRLGSNEAPPAIISMYIGEDLERIIDAIDTGSEYHSEKVKRLMYLGAHSLPKIPLDTTDRNRTSPFAFTGNKFEFRMLGSASSISDANVVLNTIVADTLKGFADELEVASNFNEALNSLVSKTIKEHKRIIFNGNNYSAEWVKEAEKRGLLNLKSTADAIPHFKAEKNIELFERHKVFSRTEVESRVEIMLSNYSKTINIEALTMLDIYKKEIYPSVNKYITELGNAIKIKQDVLPDIDIDSEKRHFKKLVDLNAKAKKISDGLDKSILVAKAVVDQQERANYYSKKIFASMQELRLVVDTMENMVSKEYWPMPSYADLIYSV